MITQEERDEMKRFVVRHVTPGRWNDPTPDVRRTTVRPGVPVTTPRDVLAAYRRFRASPVAGCLVGRSAESCMGMARTLVAFRALEDAGRVRLTVDSDDDTAYDGDRPAHMSDRSWAEWCERYAETVVGVVAEYRPGPEPSFPSSDDGYETADSICGCAGYADPTSPYENAYVVDLMRSAVDAVRQSDAMRHPDPAADTNPNVGRDGGYVLKQEWI